MMMNTAMPVSRPNVAARRELRDERALRKLMNQWAREPQAENEPEETEVTLMVMLNGMVGGHPNSFDAD